MIKVIVDEEIVKEFKDRSLFPDKFVIGASFFFREGEEWLDCLDESSAFRSGEVWLMQYDEEFIEWLKENRPEVFL